MKSLYSLRNWLSPVVNRHDFLLMQVNVLVNHLLTAVIVQFRENILYLMNNVRKTEYAEA